MTTIGHFTKKGDNYEGFLETRAWSDSATIKPTIKTGDNPKAPDYRVFAGRCEVGAAWSRKAESGAGYLSVVIDDPSFPAAINCRLLETATPQSFDLVWTRS